MASINRTQSWTAVALEALWWLRPMAWAAVAFLLWFALFTPAQAECSPNPNGNPGCNGAGNPIDIITGNKYQHEVDLAPLPGEMGLHFSRHYNSSSTHRGLTGVGWRSSFEIVLVDLGSALQIIDADGRRLTFDRHSAQPSLCVGARPEDGRVIIHDPAKDSADRATSTKARTPTYRWQRLDGSEYVFGSGSGEGHPLQSIRAASGATMTLNYLGGALDSVRDAQGRVLRFVYARPVAAGSTRHRMLALSAIETPVGRVSYKHDEYGRLLSATQPNGLVHRYHYEPERQGAAYNTWALTGISVEFVENNIIKTERLATYVYDARGRALRTQHIGGDDLTLTYGPKAATTVTTALGARTVYRHALVAGQWKTVEALGPGCGTCPPSNVRYRYRIEGPLAGQLEATLRLDAQGKPLQQERVAFDAWGRPTRVERISYINGKASNNSQKPEMVLRADYVAMPQNLQSTELAAAQYAALWRPTLVARPSVVAGREHSVAFTYNAHLQSLTKTEAGVSPIDAEGNFVPTSLTRTTTYHYAQIAGVSRLTAIDGPLPGSADTKTFHYDELGRLRFVQHPMPDLQERFAYDEAGRVVWYMPVDAVPVRTQFLDFTRTLATEPALPASVQRAQRLAQYQFNLRGWLTHWKDGALEISLIYNSEGRVVEARDASGNRVTWNRDEANKLETTRWFDSAQATSATVTARRAYMRWFDQSDRTVRTLAPDERANEYKYDHQGRLTHHLDGDGLQHLYGVRRDGHNDTHTRIDLARDGLTRLSMWTRTQPGNAGRISSSDIDTNTRRQLRDDFGRVVRADFPEHGARVAQHDAADRVERIIFADGAKVEYQYDDAGRTTRKTAIGAVGAVESNTAFRYRGAYLIEVIDPAQSTAYRYDDAGRNIETRVTLTGLGTAVAPTYTIGTIFDERGEPIEHRLADGRVIEVERDAITHLPSALTLKAHGLQRGQPIVSAIRTDPFNGLTSFTHGNALATDRQHDGAGRLTELTVSGIGSLRYEYGVGPRIRAIHDSPATEPRASKAQLFDYDGFGALRPRVATQPKARDAVEPVRRSPGLRRISFELTATQAALERDPRGRLIDDGHRRYTYDALDRLIAVHARDDGKLVARYTYNIFGERISKETYDEDGKSTQRVFLYQHSRLVAEIGVNADGTTRVDQQYIYLNGTPIAVLESERVLAIHTDHRGAPLAMTDSQQRTVWRGRYRDAWGELADAQAPAIEVSLWKRALHKVSGGRLGEGGYSSAQLNLRLPGQYADSETGLHYNLHRYYDPRGHATREGRGHPISHRTPADGRALHGQGRYLTPDPLGYPDGPDPYLYASGDPVNKIDPLGLYESDVHYYATFFLAIAAGMRAEDARTMALAAQFIDNNPATRPVDFIPFTNWVDPTSIFRNQERLLRYHFVFSDLTSGTVPVQYRIADMSNPDAKSAQLRALYSYAVPTPPQGSCNFPNSQSLQFMGEYLHAFEDTFSHRDRNNIPYNALNAAGLGVGHGLDGNGHDADYTYNHRTETCYTDDFGMPRCDITNRWEVNENRTITMEEQVYRRIVSYMDEMNFTRSGRTSGRSVSFAQIDRTLRRFNATQANDESDPRLFEEKIAILNTALEDLGFNGIDMTVGGPHNYDEATARAYRAGNFAGLLPGDFPNAILEPR